MFHTANPCADAERHFDAIFDAGEAHDALLIQDAKRLSAEFVAALPFGEDMKFEATRVGDALYDIACSSYAQLLTDIVIAAADSQDPVLVALTQRLGDAYADIVLTGGAMMKKYLIKISGIPPYHVLASSASEAIMDAQELHDVHTVTAIFVPWP